MPAARAALWAVTSYFNPTGSRRRLANYRAFRRSLAAPLLTVEWAHDGRFELGAGDADILVQIGGGDLMWQKERLLNLGIGHLPGTCRHVAWLDCDIVFDADGWPAAAAALLETAALVQLYDRVRYLAPTPLEALAGIRDWRALPCELTRVGAAATMHDPAAEARACVATADDVATFRELPSKGFAWAARRELLERNPLFDAWIVGGGDSAYFLAALGRAQCVVEQHRLAQGHRDWFLPRARALAQEVAGRIGFVPGTIRHLWHGELRHRRYLVRHDILMRHDYDPSRFLRIAETGAWSWAKPPSTLPAAIAAFFHNRLDDGIAAIAA